VTNDIAIILRHEFTAKLLEQNIKDVQIRYLCYLRRNIFEAIDRDRLNKTLDNIVNDSKIVDLTETEEKLKELKTELMKDLINREILMEKLSLFAEEEKNVFFTIENNSYAN
jgi:hypothetical protein